MGVLYYEVGRHEDALKALKIATNMNRDYAEAYNTMGRVYEALGRPSRALLRYKRALKLNDRLRSLHSNIGQLYVKMGETALAEEHFTKLVRLVCARARWAVLVIFELSSAIIPPYIPSLAAVPGPHVCLGVHQHGQASY